MFVGQWGSSVDFPEVVRIDPATRKHRNLTEFTVEVARSIDWSPPQHFWFTSKRGRKIHNLLITPANFDPSKKYPLFVLIHGGAHNMWSDQITRRWNYHLLAKPGYVMLLTNYTGSTGFGDDFANAIMGDPLRGPADELMEAADEAIKKYPFIDASRQVAGGASYGGHLANALEAWSGTRFKALISHAGLVNLESQWGNLGRHLSPRARRGRPGLGTERGLAHAEPDSLRGAVQDADASVGRREGLPRSAQQHAGDVVRPAAAARAEPSAGMAGREPLDSQR